MDTARPLLLALLLPLAAPLAGCAGAGGGGAGGGRGSADRAAVQREQAAAEAAREAEKRSRRSVTGGLGRAVDAGELSEADWAEFNRAWRLFVDRDPRWSRARADWLAKGGPAPYVLSENLFKYFWSASGAMRRDEVQRVGREAAVVGEPAVGYFADLLVLEKWPLREATVSTSFNPDNATQPLQRTVTHLEIDDVTRQDAALVLAAIGAPAVPTLASPQVLQAPVPSARTYAAYALGRIGDDAAVRALAGLLRSSPEWKDRGAAAKALGFALKSNPSARAPLEAALTDPDAFVRRKAQEGLDGKVSLEF